MSFTASFNHLSTVLQYSWSVRGFYAAAVDSFVLQHGCVTSDMFRLELTSADSGQVSLAEFQKAFLLSPLFQLELWILGKVYQGRRGQDQNSTGSEPSFATTTTRKHLELVASGQESSFGPWTTRAEQGDRAATIQTVAPATNLIHLGQQQTIAAVIMRCCLVPDKPFVDTWWAIEQEQSSGAIDLVFGSALIYPGKPPLIIRLFDPLHRLYSRLLLASAKAYLLAGRRNNASTVSGLEKPQ